ncbi:OmpH family outer membrane protein [bacterium]|nr:OmpH family outer membrane protein [bacterium]
MADVEESVVETKGADLSKKSEADQKTAEAKAADAGKKPEGPTESKTNKNSKIWIAVGAVVLIAACICGWLFFVPNDIIKAPPAKRVASLDADAIYALDEFKNAEKQMKEFSDKKAAEFDKALKEKNGKAGAEAELQLLYRQLQNEVEVNNNKTMLPLKNKVTAAIAYVSAKKGLSVVLDKRIVVCGVPDITDEVKTVFQQKEEVKLPSEEDGSDSPIAYFDQSIVRKLKVFGEVDIKLTQARSDMAREYEKKAPKLSDSEREAMQREMSARFEALSQQMYAPLYQKVNNSVNKVAKDLGISLVLNKQTVMYGGRNITDEVIDTFNASLTGGAADESAASVPVADKAPAAK